LRDGDYVLKITASLKYTASDQIGNPGIHMKFGIMLGATPDPDATLDKYVDIARDVEARGFDSLWLAHIRTHDAVMAMALAGRETKKIEVGTAVTPIQPRHPMALAQQALSASDMAKGRFTLGIGLSHKIVIEDMLGLSWTRLAKTMEEYLLVLNPLLQGETAALNGEQYQVEISLTIEKLVWRWLAPTATAPCCG